MENTSGSVRKVVSILLTTVLIVGVGLFYWWSGMLLISLLMFLMLEPLTSGWLFGVFVKKRMNEKAWKFLKYLYPLLFALFIAFFVRVFVVEVRVVPTYSMERSLPKGSVALFEKITLGPDVTDGMLSMPFGHFFVNASVNRAEEQNRLQGTGDIQKGDIVLFSIRKYDATKFVKRVIGMPGETIRIVDSYVFCDDLLQDEREGFVFAYHMESDSAARGPKLMLSNAELLNHPEANELTRFVQAPRTTSESIFPDEKVFDWNIDNYGPIRIPRKGMEVQMNFENYAIYQSIIEAETELKLVTKDSTYMLGDHPLHSYTFQQNYYFMMGDNRTRSHDSRMFGFIADTNLIGKLF